MKRFGFIAILFGLLFCQSCQKEATDVPVRNTLEPVFYVEADLIEDDLSIPIKKIVGIQPDIFASSGIFLLLGSNQLIFNIGETLLPDSAIFVNTGVTPDIAIYGLSVRINGDSIAAAKQEWDKSDFERILQTDTDYQFGKEFNEIEIGYNRNNLEAADNGLLSALTNGMTDDNPINSFQILSIEPYDWDYNGTFKPGYIIEVAFEAELAKQHQSGFPSSLTVELRNGKGVFWIDASR